MLSEVLKKLRKNKNVTQADIAKLLGITQQAVARWESNKSEPDMETLKRLARYFNVSTDYLLGNEPMETPNYYLENEESNLIDNFRKLNTKSKQLILEMIGQLTFSQRTA